MKNLDEMFNAKFKRTLPSSTPVRLLRMGVHLFYNNPQINIYPLGRCSGQVVRVLAFYSDNPCLNPTKVQSFLFRKLFIKTDNKQKQRPAYPIKSK